MLEQNERDRSFPFHLLEELRHGNELKDQDLEKLSKALVELDDYRLVQPLTEIVMDANLAAKVRETASLTLCSYCTDETAEERAKWWHDGDETIKRHAIRVAEKEEAELVVALAKDPLNPFFAEALEKLGSWSEPHYQEILIQALDLDQPKFRAIAAKALIWEQPVRAEKRLLEIAMESDREAAKAALHTLCYCVSNELLLKLAELKESTTDKYMKAEYENAFGWVAKEYKFFLSDKYWENNSARQYFENWSKPARQLLKENELSPKEDQDASVQSNSNNNNCQFELTQKPESSNYELDVSKIIADLRVENGQKNEKINRYRNLDRLRDLSKQEQKKLLKFLSESPDPNVRLLAVEASKVLKNSKSMYDLLNDKCLRVRRSSIHLCKHLEPNEHIAQKLLQTIINQNTDGSMAIEALESYFVHASTLGQPEWLLSLALYDKRPMVRREAVLRLRELDDKDKSKKLLAILNEPPCNTWSLHIAVIENCLSLNIDIPYSSLAPLKSVDNPSLQEALAKALFRPTAQE